MNEAPANTLILQDHEETFVLLIAEALFCILEDGKLSLSLATEPHPSMGEAVFTFERVPVEDGLTSGTVLSIPYAQGERYSLEAASTHLYFGAHDDPLHTQVTVTSSSPEALEIAGQFLWHELYHPESGTMRYAQARLHAWCRRAEKDALRVLM